MSLKPEQSGFAACTKTLTSKIFQRYFQLLLPLPLALLSQVGLSHQKSSPELTFCLAPGKLTTGPHFDPAVLDSTVVVST